MFPRLRPCDTRPGNWPCCPVRRRNRRERSADMVSSDWEYSARDIIHRLSRHAQTHTPTWRIFPSFILISGAETLNFNLARNKRHSKHQAGSTRASHPPVVSIKTRSHALLIDTDFFSICHGSAPNATSRTFFVRTDQYERWLVWAYFTSPTMIRDQMTRVSAPTRSRSGRFMRRAVVFIQDMCVCAMRKVQ